MFPLALWGGWRWHANGRLPLPILWSIGTLLLFYLPITPFSGRFALGLIVPIATLAAFGLETWLAEASFAQPWVHRLTPTPVDTIRRVVLILLLPSTLILPLWLTRGVTQTADFPFYIPADEVAAIDWLAKQSDPTTLTLADYPVSSFMPRVYQGRLFIGQLYFTTRFDDKLADVEYFFSSDTPEIERLAFLNEWAIDYIYVGQFEQALMRGEVVLPGTVVYENESVTIYQVK